jgi:hypothetical protein
MHPQRVGALPAESAQMSCVDNRGKLVPRHLAASTAALASLGLERLGALYSQRRSFQTDSRHYRLRVAPFKLAKASSARVPHGHSDHTDWPPIPSFQNGCN